MKIENNLSKWLGSRKNKFRRNVDDERKKKKKKKEKVWDTAIRYKIVPTIRKFENKMLLGKEGRKEVSERETQDEFFHVVLDI